MRYGKKVSQKHYEEAAVMTTRNTNRSGLSKVQRKIKRACKKRGDRVERRQACSEKDS